MNAVARPVVSRSQSLNDEQRLSEPNGFIDRMLKREIPAQASIRDHPVDDELTIPAYGKIIQRSDAQG